MDAVVIPSCPGCHRRCPMNNVQCQRGLRFQENFESAPTCPGCHIGCSLAYPQCARGIRFHDAWERGEEIPQRRFPGGPMGGPRGPMGGPGAPSGGPMGGRGPWGDDPNQKLNFLLTGIVPRILGEDARESVESQILSCLVRQDGAMTFEAMPERVRASQQAIYSGLSHLMEQGLVRGEGSVWLTYYYWITDEGREAEKQAQVERSKSLENRFSCLSPEEKSQLIDSLEKILASARK